MAITLTEQAANRVQAFLAKRGKGVALRLGEYEQALAQFEQSLEMKRRVGDRTDILPVIPHALRTQL